MVENWYEVNVKVNNKNIIVATPASLEEAEELKESLKKKLLTANIIHWKIDKGILIKVEDIND